MALLLTEEDQIRLREFIKTKLSVGKHEIVFEKKDKSIRVLRGTRDPEVIGEVLFEKYMNPPPKKDGSKRVESTTAVPTFDCEIDQWRSFATDVLISIDGISTSELLKQANINLDGN